MYEITEEPVHGRPVLVTDGVMSAKKGFVRILRATQDTSARQHGLNLLLPSNLKPFDGKNRSTLKSSTY